MDFVGIVIFAIVLYVRPQEIIGFLSAFRPAQASLALSALGLFIREGGFSPKSIIRTPMDWMVTAYFVYILFWTPGTFGDLWGQLYPFIGFYFLVVLALTNFQRIYQYLAWWCGCVFVPCAPSISGRRPGCGSTGGSLRGDPSPAECDACDIPPRNQARSTTRPANAPAAGRTTARKRSAIRRATCSR